VGFEDEHRAIDESHYARIAAKHLNCNLEEIVVTKKEASNLFSQLITFLPFTCAQPVIPGFTS
jgi:asparagine synthetase B (glutamine-hydrolysing)